MSSSYSSLRIPAAGANAALSDLPSARSLDQPEPSAPARGASSYPNTWEGVAHSGELYTLATSDVEVLEDIRLAQTRLGLAVLDGDDKAILAWLGMLHPLVRVQQGIGPAEGELAATLGRIGEEVRREAER